jgi:hypothetical protein
MDRLNIRNILRRKKHRVEGNDYNCILCPNNRKETTFHLFFSCPLQSSPLELPQHPLELYN